MLDLSRIRESHKIRSVSIRKPISDIISESYELLYQCENQKIRTLIEAHIENIRETPKELTALANNLYTLQKLVENEGITDPRVEVKGDTDLDIDTEMKQVTDIEAKEPEEHETETREKKTETAVETSTTNPMGESKKLHADKSQFKKFSENSKGKVFLKNLKKSTLNESSTVFNLDESVSLYKASNSMMTQLAIELEHNHAFMETFSVLSKVLGTTLTSLCESIRSSEPIPTKVRESLSRFSKALTEDDEIDDFIEWVDDEYPSGEEEPSDDGEESSEDGGVSTEDVVDTVVDQIDTVPDEEVSDVVSDVVDQLVADAPVDETPIEDQVSDLTDEEAEDLKKYLCILRGCAEDSEEAAAEPTEDEVDALEERLMTRRSRRECDSPKSMKTVKKTKPEEV